MLDKMSFGTRPLTVCHAVLSVDLLIISALAYFFSFRALQIRKGEIFAILGHNGAGKTTTIGMLMGVIAASEGEIRIMGHDMRADPHLGRKHIGFCPQHDIVFDELTVYEHLKIFATIKGVPWNEQQQEIENLVDRLRLTEKMHCLSRTLSGGQKRCLSVGIALIGGSSAVFLDEPSTGDPSYAVDGI